MPDISMEILSRFFQQHLPFCPTPRQVDGFKADLSLVSPFLMEAALMEVRAGTRGYRVIHRPDEWRAAIFSVYNRKVAEHSQLFPIFHSFEIAFRSTVAVALEAHYQHKRWWRAIYNELQRGGRAKNISTIGPVPIGHRAAWRIGQIMREIDGVDLSGTSIAGLNNGYEFMDCCDLNHAKQLIEEHWSIFAPRFAPLTLNDFSAKFDRVREARNKVYHHKSVARRTAVIAAAEELLDHLQFSLRFVYGKINGCRPQAPTFSRAIEPRHRTR